MTDAMVKPCWWLHFHHCWIQCTDVCSILPPSGQWEEVCNPLRFPHHRSDRRWVGCDDWHPWTWQTATCRSYYRTMHQCRSQAMGCSRSSPPRAWLDHTRDGGDVLEHLRIILILILLLSSILVGGFLNILVCIAVASIVACGWWGLFAFLSRGFDDMAGNDWTRKKRSKSIIYSLVWIIQCTFTQSFIYG